MNNPRPLGLAALLIGLTWGSPAHASYRDGALGFFIVLYSVPFAFVAVMCTMVCWSLGLFRRPWFFALYSLAAVAAALVGVGLTLSANDPTSTLWALIGESVFLIPVLLPAILQYSRAGTPTIQSPAHPDPAAGDDAAAPHG
jgi:hypothetical protein